MPDQNDKTEEEIVEELVEKKKLRDQLIGQALKALGLDRPFYSADLNEKGKIVFRLYGGGTLTYTPEDEEAVSMAPPTRTHKPKRKPRKPSQPDLHHSPKKDAPPGPPPPPDLKHSPKKAPPTEPEDPRKIKAQPKK